MTLERTESSTSASIATRESPGRDNEAFRINPLLALFIGIDDLNITMSDLLERTPPLPKGDLVPFSGTQEGGPATIVDLDPPLFGFTLTNDGPDDLQYTPGNEQAWCTLKKDEVFSTDMRRPIIDRIAFQCAPGATVNWRLTGVR